MKIKLIHSGEDGWDVVREDGNDYEVMGFSSFPSRT